MLENSSVAHPKSVSDRETDAPPSLAEARKVLLRWAEALSAKDIEALLVLYAEEAILVPTMQNDICKNTGERRTYFEMLLENPDLNCRLDSLRMSIGRKAGIAISAGHYTFSFKRDGEDETIPARFLYSLEEIDGVWLITGHHSSKFV